MARGVLTNGQEWIFIILKLDSNGGGTYRLSGEMGIHALHPTELTKVLSRDAVSLISSILAHWVCFAECFLF